ncbi:uncharacterized protein LOC110671344 [Hevea brasiliensis]|uniref:uncharacterized protein LOC110671344 n=1 Tax=Hevea brasiliensis TaxID=3981 RepID=UPI0025E31A81|nr:uncharacterized protein LOC110671344 [Hevea brasiliensis]XP_057995359.1 uncharacterized protein LOC110671344 [Hevea brasiliensis]
METELEVDPIQVDLLHGKAYSDWGHASDAVSVYDQLISSHPNQFWVYLAKAIILKENGNVGHTETIQFLLALLQTYRHKYKHAGHILKASCI